MSIKVINDCTACPASLYNSCQDTFGPEYVNDGDEFGCGLLGCKLKCRHTGPTASAQDCCLDTVPSNRSCNKSLYYRGSPACDSVMKSYCQQGDKVHTDAKCKEWCTLRPDACRETKAAYCTKHLDMRECRDWCNRDENAGACAAGVQDFCDVHPTDPYCSCLKSVILNIDAGVNPKCVDQDCLMSGWLSQNMRNANCPNIINCDLKLAVENSGVSFATSVPVEQNCGSTGDQVNKNVEVTNTLPPIQDDRKMSTGMLVTIMVLVFILFVLIGVLLYYLLT